MISEFTLFRPGSHPGALTLRLFHEQFLVALPLPDQLTGALGDIAVALRRDPADRRSLADWAARFRTTTSRLSEDIRSQSGASFLQWRSHIIMDIARELLRAGDPPGEVSRKLAYASPAAFSKAFAKAHGMSPSQYRRREGDADA